MIRPFYKLLLAAALSILWTPVFSSRDSIRTYTEEHPLVYEDVWDLWPYSFLNDAGEPVGYTIDLLKLICNELNIPYRVKLKPLQDALDDLKTGRADLMCGLDVHYYYEYAHYGQSVIQIFTHSAVHHKNEEKLVKSVDDLAAQQVIVHSGSISHNIMVERGEDQQAMHSNDMQEAVQYVHNHPGTQIVGNTMSLKWLLHKFDYDDLELTPVNIPHGEYKFMSNDERLLEQFDSVFTLLNSSGRLQPIQKKWFYPDYKDTGIPSWVWYVIAALLVVIVTILGYYISYRLYERKMMKNVSRSNDRLSLILNTSKVHIWLFDIAGRMVTNITPEGKRITIPLSPNFVHYYVLPEDYERLCSLIDDIATQKKEHETLELHAVKTKSKTSHIFSVDFSVMKRDKSGHPTVIIGATTDITAARERQQQEKDTMLRYQHIFNSAFVDNVLYDENGYIEDMNKKATKAVGGNLKRIVDAHISIQSVLGDSQLKLDDLDYIYLTQIYKSNEPDDKRPLKYYLNREEFFYELQVVPIREEGGRLIGIYGTGRDVTELAQSYSRLQKNTMKLQEATEELQDYVRNIDYVMKNGGVRVVNYSPDTHTLTVYSEVDRVQYELTQTRLLALVDEESKKTAQRIINNMDNLTQQPVKAVVRTSLPRLFTVHSPQSTVHSSLQSKAAKPSAQSTVHSSQPAKQHLYLSFSFVPVKDDNGNVTKYFGMCRDISNIKATEELLALETKKAQEVEMLKDSFLRNMCYEIRTPLTSVVGFAELIEQNPDADEEHLFIEEIKNNSHSLLNLVNNILFLSRLDAGMIEFKTEPVDFTIFFEQRCKSAWQYCQQPGVEYIVENFYEHLVLDIDMSNLGIVIDQIVSNAAQHTTSGYVRARFDYNGDDLTVAVQDTGSGIPAEQFDKIFERFSSTHSGRSGLGLSICQEVVKLMGGRIRMKSEVGKGTIFWVIIPCSCSEVVRK